MPDDVASCCWPRFAGYEVVETPFGETVRPRSGGKMEWYNPASSDFGALSRALTELVAMLRGPLDVMEKRMLAYPLDAMEDRTWAEHLHTVEAWAPRLKPRACGQLLQWIREHGLLGVLVERLEVIRSAPLPYQLGTFQQHAYRRVAHEWTSQNFAPLLDEDTRRPGAEMFHERDGGLELTDVGFSDPEWLRFFPTVVLDSDSDPENYAYGAPDSEAFWRVYGEPISRLLLAVLGIDRAQRALAAPKAGVAPEWITFHRGELNRLGIRVSQALMPAEGRRHRVGWCYASLWGLLASSAIWATGRQGIRVCVRCGTVFLSGRADALYCGDRCKKAAAQWRARHPKSEEADD